MLKLAFSFLISICVPSLHRRSFDLVIRVIQHYISRRMIRVGTGFDIHRFGRARRLVLGGVVIPGVPGLVGHSDADALCHAVADALLGAVADGDIGTHFPNTDPRYHGADSIELLRIVAERLRHKGYSIVNVDSTVLAERPKIAPHREAMRLRLARAMGVGVEAVSVKATTMERLGAIGRCEGIAAIAVATVETTQKPARG
jgi:2-C-methyl-D-erythritol 2,4-cyclodiphosphate synthase